MKYLLIVLPILFTQIIVAKSFSNHPKALNESPDNGGEDYIQLIYNQNNKSIRIKNTGGEKTILSSTLININTGSSSQLINPQIIPPYINISIDIPSFSNGVYEARIWYGTSSSPIWQQLIKLVSIRFNHSSL